MQDRGCGAQEGITRASRPENGYLTVRVISDSNSRPAVGEPSRFTCTLEGVDNRGIVVSYESGTRRITRFYSWRAVPYAKPGQI